MGERRAAFAALGRLVVLVVGASLLATPSVARACGAAYPGGPVMCAYPRRDGPPAEGAFVPRVRLTTSWAFTSTTLLFGEGRRADLVRHAAFGGVELPIAPRVSLHYGGGGILAGQLTRPGARADLGPGASGFVGAGARLVDERRLRPFVQLTATLSVSHARLGPEVAAGAGARSTAPAAPAAPEPTRYTALDVRAGALVGKTFADAVTPYAAARVFGGPIFTLLGGAEVTGTDRYKYQVGGGLSVALAARRVDVFVEAIGLGERGVSAGLGASF